MPSSIVSSYTGHFRFGGLKMFLDGSPQGLTAWMTEPYTAGPDGEKDWVAYSTMTDEDAIAFAKMAIDSNHQLLCHCNGDAAADQLSARLRSGAGRFGQPGEDGPAPGDDPRPDGAHRPV